MSTLNIVKLSALAFAVQFTLLTYLSPYMQALISKVASQSSGAYVWYGFIALVSAAVAFVTARYYYFSTVEAKPVNTLTFAGILSGTNIGLTLLPLIITLVGAESQMRQLFFSQMRESGFYMPLLVTIVAIVVGVALACQLKKRRA